MTEVSNVISGLSSRVETFLRCLSFSTKSNWRVGGGRGGVFSEHTRTAHVLGPCGTLPVWGVSTRRLLLGRQAAFPNPRCAAVHGAGCAAALPRAPSPRHVCRAPCISAQPVTVAHCQWPRRQAGVHACIRKLLRDISSFIGATAAVRVCAARAWYLLGVLRRA